MSIFSTSTVIQCGCLTQSNMVPASLWKCPTAAAIRIEKSGRCRNINDKKSNFRTVWWPWIIAHHLRHTVCAVKTGTHSIKRGGRISAGEKESFETQVSVRREVIFATSFIDQPYFTNPLFNSTNLLLLKSWAFLDPPTTTFFFF